MCLGSSKPEVVKPAEAPPAPEATPEDIIAPEATDEKARQRKQQKTKATGLDAYKTSTDVTGLNVPTA